MATEKLPWFVTERSEILTTLLVTERPDLRLLHRREREDGVDFVVGLGGAAGLDTRMFVIQVRGTTTSDPDECRRAVDHLIPGDPAAIFGPTCVFVIDVRDNRHFYAWVAAPAVERGRPVLRFPEVPDFQPLDRAALDQIVDRVAGWHAALARVLQPA
ncbi:hypothetical protein [Urbifossiella limnaea]|uniref:DUF4365 domain-containing protein n=1 Tax=Urbifossiella limnaea TaxID=2528023 RepID=A0A517XLJ0_9BACT|nr:hypothetical protein [Urbifossiella limnaea]QDU18375.1 hypothetical protein ETAA1_02610 [Urbifossiella limnaea]